MFEFLKVVTPQNANLYDEWDCLDTEACCEIGIPEDILGEFDGISLVSKLPEEKPMYKGHMLLDGEHYSFFRYPDNMYLVLE